MFESVQGFVHGGTPFTHAPRQRVPHDDQGHSEQDFDALAHEHVPDAEHTRPGKRPETLIHLTSNRCFKR